METTRTKAEPTVPMWRVRPRRDETPFRLENLRALALHGSSAPPPPRPDVTWMTDVQSSSAPLFSAASLPYRPSRPGARRAAVRLAAQPGAPEIDLAVDPVGPEREARRSRRIATAAGAILVAGVLALVALVGVLVTELRLGSPDRIELSEMQELPAPVVLRSGVVTGVSATAPSGGCQKLAALSEAELESACVDAAVHPR